MNHFTINLFIHIKKLYFRSYNKILGVNHVQNVLFKMRIIYKNIKSIICQQRKVRRTKSRSTLSQPEIDGQELRWCICKIIDLLEIELIAKN